ncbi:MAG: hypothetical protein ACRDKH_05940, partial [Solirubrobacterales bacterium]
IPAATGLKHYRTVQIEPVEPAAPPAEELLSEEELQADLELSGDGESSQLEGFGPSFAEELEQLASEIEDEKPAEGAGQAAGEGESSGEEESK